MMFFIVGGQQQRDRRRKSVASYESLSLELTCLVYWSLFVAPACLLRLLCVCKQGSTEAVGPRRS